MDEPGGGRGGRALRNGAPQTGSGPDGSSPQRTALCAVGNLTVAPGTRPPPVLPKQAFVKVEARFSDISWSIVFIAEIEEAADADGLPEMRDRRQPV